MSRESEIAKSYLRRFKQLNDELTKVQYDVYLPRAINYEVRSGEYTQPRDHVLNHKLERISELTNEMKHIHDLVGQLFGNHCVSWAIIGFIYFDGVTLRQTATAMHYSYDHIKTLHIKALEDFFEVMVANGIVS